MKRKKRPPRTRYTAGQMTARFVAACAVAAALIGLIGTVVNQLGPFLKRPDPPLCRMVLP